MTIRLSAAQPVPELGPRVQPLRIICPDCGASSVLNDKLIACDPCGRRFRHSLPIFDFVNAPERTDERTFYDSAYAETRRTYSTKQPIDSVQPIWKKADSPENGIVLTKLGHLYGKHVLLLGNGESVKELLFLKMNPAQLVYSDLSTHALINIYERFDLKEYHGQLTFAAIDAHAIPFPTETFDVVYAFAMVHHLPDLDRFFASVINVLRPGGYAVFMDDAFAPVWHYSKQSWLKPLMKFSHSKTGISPEDYRFSMSGGFKESDLGNKIRAAGGEPWFVRASFLTYLFYRGAEKLLPRRFNRVLRSQRICGVVNRFDRWLCKLRFFERNQIRLIWGFSKAP